MITYLLNLVCLWLSNVLTIDWFDWKGFHRMLKNVRKNQYLFSRYHTAFHIVTPLNK